MVVLVVVGDELDDHLSDIDYCTASCTLCLRHPLISNYLYVSIARSPGYDGSDFR